MFAKDLRDGDSNMGTTIIALGCSIKGSTSDLKGPLHIDGIIDGVIESKSHIVISKTGKVKGSITADSVLISGQLEGDVECNNLEITASGVLIGDVKTDIISIEKNAKFIGNSTNKKGEWSMTSSKEKGAQKEESVKK